MKSGTEHEGCTPAEPAKCFLDDFSAQRFNKQAVYLIINGELVDAH